MTHRLSTTDIKNRSIEGAKWLLVMNAVGMPAASASALLLGRAGPAALGSYALAQVLINVITAFVIYGGSPVLSVFLPKLPRPEDRGRFIFSYGSIVFGLMAVALGLFWLFPGGFRFLLRREFDMQNYGWFILLTIVVVITETAANTASGLMLIKTASIARQMMRLVLLPVVATLFVFGRGILIRFGLECILGGYVAGYVLAAIISLVAISREERLKVRPSWLLPPGFWAFSSATMMSTVFSFLYANIDRMAVFSTQELEGLGMYQAVLTINTLIEKIPLLLRPSIVPAFSNLLGANHHTAFRQAFSLLGRWAVVPVTLVSLAVMAFSREALLLFGPEYADYAHLLTLFGLVGIVRSLNVATYVATTCLEKNAFRFVQQFLSVLGQGTLTLLLMSHYGVVAIAGAKMISVSAASFAAVLYVYLGLGLGRRLPLSYQAAVLSGAVMAVLRIWVLPAGWLASTVLMLSCTALFIAVSQFSVDEIRGIVRFTVQHDSASLVEASTRYV